MAELRTFPEDSGLVGCRRKAIMNEVMEHVGAGEGGGLTPFMVRRMNRNLFRAFVAVGNASGREGVDMCWNCFPKNGEFFGIEIIGTDFLLMKGDNPWRARAINGRIR